MSIEAGNQARSRAADVVKEHEERLHKARAQGQATINDILSQAQGSRDAQVEKLHTLGQSKVQEVKTYISGQKALLIDKLEEEEKVLVTMIVKKLLGESASPVLDSKQVKAALQKETC